MKPPWSRKPEAVSEPLPAPPPIAAPIDPLSRPHPHHVIAGPAALKAFTWISQWENAHDRAAQCRLWQFIHSAFPDTREGRWSISMTLTTIVVWLVPSEESGE